MPNLNVPSKQTTVLAFLCLLALSVTFSYGRGSLQYAVHGQTVQAAVTDLTQRCHERRRLGGGTVCSSDYAAYAFTTPDGQVHKGNGRVPAEIFEHLKIGDRIPVRFIVGSPDANVPDYGEDLAIALYSAIAFFALLLGLRKSLRASDPQAPGIPLFPAR